MWVCELADTYLGRALGIMFRKEFEPVLFTFCRKVERPVSIHSFFCPGFCAVFLDRMKRIVQMKRMPPSRLFTSKPASYMIEVKDTKGLAVGDKLFWE